MIKSMSYASGQLMAFHKKVKPDTPSLLPPVKRCHIVDSTTCFRRHLALKGREGEFLSYRKILAIAK